MASFSEMKVGELREIALKKFPEDAEEIPAWTKEETIAAFKEAQYTLGDYNAEKRAAEAFSDEPAPERTEEESKEALDSGKEILVKMTRLNPSYQWGKYIFTKEHPFLVMPEDDAQDLFDSEEGFAPANPREAANYYN